MPIRFACTCGKVYTVADDAAGKRARCKVCGLESRVPRAYTSPPIARAPDISYRCPQCDIVLTLKAMYANEEATCGGCGGRTIVPKRRPGQAGG